LKQKIKEGIDLFDYLIIGLLIFDFKVYNVNLMILSNSQSKMNISSNDINLQNF
jgi:hypothetical protein